MLKTFQRRVRVAVWSAAVAAGAMLVAALPAQADVKLPAVIGDSMVLQQGQPVPIWGWADKGEEVTVSFAGQTASTKAGDDGKWSVVLKALTASDQPAELKVTGKNAITLKDVLVGEVWLASGQSNMEWSVRQSKDAEKEIAAAKWPNIRLFDVPNTTADEPQYDTKAKWTATTPETIAAFSAVGFYFGRELHQNLKVPVGIVHSSWGGTRAEAWTAVDYLKKDADFAATVVPIEVRTANYEKAKAAYEQAKAKHADAAAKAKAEGKPVPQPPRAPNPPGRDPNAASVLYNGMITPVAPFAIKGAIWYQGESNSGKAYHYRKLLPTMIQSWRDLWAAGGSEKDFKFLIVQLANYQKPAEKPGDDAWAELREAQNMTAALPNNGIALAIDLADADNPGDIHPKNKQDVGKRLSLVALAKAYGKDVKYAGPTFKSVKFDGGKAVISFSDAEGLTAKGHEGKLKGFAVAGEDKQWKWAEAKIEGDTVVVMSPEVAKPVAVRYAWSINPVANLYNAADLPANPFRTDDWPGVTQPKPAP
jgi:sialate O-acetylesterase